MSVDAKYLGKAEPPTRGTPTTRQCSTGRSCWLFGNGGQSSSFRPERFARDDAVVVIMDGVNAHTGTILGLFQGLGRQGVLDLEEFAEFGFAGEGSGRTRRVGGSIVTDAVMVVGAVVVAHEIGRNALLDGWWMVSSSMVGRGRIAASSSRKGGRWRQSWSWISRIGTVHG